MDFDYELTLETTFYFWGTLLLLPLWLYGFLKHKESRLEMLICGFLFGLAAVIIGYVYATNDYWDPPYIFNNVLHLEDFLYGFLFGGISAEIFEIVLRVQEDRARRKRRFALIPIFIVISVLAFVLFVDVLGWNSIIAHIIPPFIVGLFCVFLNRDFLFPTIIAGISMLIITFVWQSIILLIYPNAIVDVWLVENLSGFMLNGIPVEELIFAFTLGFGASCFYELVMGYEYTKRQ